MLLNARILFAFLSSLNTSGSLAGLKIFFDVFPFIPLKLLNLSSFILLNPRFQLRLFLVTIIFGNGFFYTKNGSIDPPTYLSHHSIQGFNILFQLHLISRFCFWICRCKLFGYGFANSTIQNFFQHDNSPPLHSLPTVPSVQFFLLILYHRLIQVKV